MTYQTLPGSLHIDTVDWAHYQITLSNIRKTVFIEEQNVPEDLEWDGLDNTAVHILAQLKIDNQYHPAGTARILIKGNIAHIGRMAVLAQWRGYGIGQKLLHSAIAECRKRNIEKIMLNAQTYVLNFYQQAGFKVSSDEFMDAGIAHNEMTLLVK